MEGAALITHYFPNLSDRQKEQFAQLGPLYREWNARINVISRKDIDDLYERHVLHSLGIAKVLDFQPGTKILDVGTGGGFPGIPLAILFPDCSFHLIDSIGKKIRVVSEVATALELKNVRAEQVRAEKVRAKFDFVVSRAVTNMPAFWNWVRKRMIAGGNHRLANGILYLKGGDLSEELADFNRSVTLYNLLDFFPQEFFETKKVVHIPAS